MFSVQFTGATSLMVILNNAAIAASGVGGMYATVGTDLSYARYVHDGTAPHVITARNAKALYWTGAKHPVQSVNHPGYKGNPFLTSALADKAAEVTAELGTGMEQILVGAAGPDGMAARLLTAGLIVQGEAQTHANVRTGQLRQSLHTQVAGGRLP
jgi:hypothetical protein